MSNERIKIEQHSIRAEVAVASISEDKRTVDVVFATDHPVRRYDWNRDQVFDEVLVFTPDAVRMDRMAKGAPVLDDHDRWGGVRSQLGVVESARIENGRGVATLRLSKRADLEPIWQDIKDGIIRNISVGYKVHKYERTRPASDDEIPVYRAVDWEPQEVSFVTIPADPNSNVTGVRADQKRDLYEVSSFFNKPNQVPMENEQEKKERGEGTAPAPPTPPTTPAAPNADELRAEAIRAERKRVKEITDSVRAAKLPVEFAERLIEAGTGIDEARKLIIEEFAKGDPTAEIRGTAPSASAGVDRAEEHARASITDALLLRAGGEAAKTVQQNEQRMKSANDYRGLSLLEIGRRLLEKRGINTTGMSRAELASRALSSTSDFPVLLENTMHKLLLTGYQITPDEWRNFCAVGSVSDFRPHHRYRTGALGNLQRVNQNGEYTHMPLTDAEKQSVSAGTYGKIITISREMLINDDLNGFARLSTDLGRSAARTINAAVFALLGENGGLGPVLSDNKTLFHADHGNIGVGAALSVTSLDADGTKMRDQKEPGGQDWVEIRPSVLLLPIALESQANIYNQAQFNVDVNNRFQVPNQVAGLFQRVIGTPRLIGTRRYMFADPNIEPVIEVSFLDGNQTPYMEMEENFKTDGVSWKVRHDFGVGGVGYRGALTNAGVA